MDRVALGIDVWLAFYDRFDHDRLDALRALLTQEERLQEGRYYFADDRRRYIVTRGLVRNVLSRYAPVAPECWRFATNAYGRPEIAPTQAQIAPGLDFNISHTRGLIALAVTRGLIVGVDVEHVNHREAPLDMAHHYFSPAEAAALAKVTPSEQQERFFEYWTFKESYIKARGMGLSLPLDRFEFRFPHAQGVKIEIAQELGDHSSRWCFWQFRPTRQHILALSAKRAGTTAPSVRFVVFGSDGHAEMLMLDIARASDS